MTGSHPSPYTHNRNIEARYSAHLPSGEVVSEPECVEQNRESSRQSSSRANTEISLVGKTSDGKRANRRKEIGTVDQMP